MNEQQITNELLRKIATQNDTIVAQNKCTNRLLEKIVRRLDEPRMPKEPSEQKVKGDERVALAVVEIARGASSYQEIADKLGVSRGTVSKNPAIRRAMEASVRDRRPVDKEAAEEFKFEKGR